MQLSLKEREYLAAHDPEFRPLMEQHRQYEEELESLSHLRSFLRNFSY